MFGQIWRWIDGYASFGTEGLPEQEKSKRYAFGIVCGLGGLAAIGYAIFYMAYDYEGLRPAWYAAIVCIPVLLLPLLAKRSILWALIAGTFIVTGVFSYLTYHLGADSGLFLFMLLGTVAVILVLGTSHTLFALIVFVLVIVAMVASFLLFQEPSGAARVTEELQQILFASVIVFLTAMMIGGIYALAMRVAQAEAALALEHARSEALLRNLLPEDIAARLKDKPGDIIADDLAAVTLLFADIVDFTPRASRMEPEALVGFLNRIFSAFDRLTEDRGLEKIKTIGDAYMVAAGLPLARADHAEVIADMALAMQAEMARLSDELGEQVQVRIGLHSGPAIAGVIGTRKVFYDVWGETVNTASRMESHGVSGRIQVTRATHDALQKTYVLEPRGPVAIKGVGEIETFWLTGKI